MLASLRPAPTPPPAPSRRTLSKQKPLNRVMSLPLAVSTVLQLGVVVAFQLLALLMLSRQPGYVATVGTPDLTMAQARGTLGGRGRCAERGRGRGLCGAGVRGDAGEGVRRI